MNQQELSYFDPEPDEVQELTEQVSDYVTPEQSMLRGEKLTVIRRRKKPYVNIIGMVLVLLMVFLGLSTWQNFQKQVDHQQASISVGPKSAPISDSPTTQSVPVSNFAGTYTFPISGYPEISIYSMNQDVHINTGANNKITVSETAKQNELENIHLDLVNDNQVEVTEGSGNIDDPPPPSLSGELDVTVPASVSAVIYNTGGNIFINGVTGSLQANTDHGDIQVQQTYLTDTPSLYTSNGNIRFVGNFDPDSIAGLTTKNGSISIILPSNTAFRLLHVSGSIQNDFQSSRVGGGPQADLTIEADNGTITIQKADS